ncbi:hypothetical protein [Streptomyces sp. NPDC002952]|uniref:hypothetical protein n=1 Tax=Streptomyces sp. NPDC002952 TaxID=3364673 RepID=UPI0036C68E54
MWGPVHTADVAGRNRDSYVVMYVAQNPVHIDGKPLRLRVALRSGQPDWIGAATRSGQVLGYGYWQLFPTDPANALRQGWIELQLWVKQPWQATRWDTDGTTITLPKRRTTPKPKPAPETRTSPPPAPAPPARAPTSQAKATQPPQDNAAADPKPDAPPEPHEDAPQPPAPPTEPAPAAPSRPAIVVPPLPPFPPPVPDAGERRTRFARWLDSARRSRRT